MKVIGITGGVGAGKSRVLALLEEEFGARIILADEVARQLQEPGQPGFVRLLEYFGDGILGKDGRLERAGLAARIFRDQEALEAVNRMIHPLVWQRIQKMAADFGKTPAAGGWARMPDPRGLGRLRQQGEPLRGARVPDRRAPGPLWWLWNRPCLTGKAAACARSFGSLTPPTRTGSAVSWQAGDIPGSGAFPS